MKRHEFDHNMREYLEGLRIPMAVYQFIDKRVVTLVLSAGFRDLFEFDDLSDAYYVMENDMYSTAHPDDASRIAESVFKFATEGGKLEMVYRIQTRRSKDYKIIHAMGEHVFLDTGERLAYVWYTDEGRYTADPEENDDLKLGNALRRALREESLVHQSFFDSLTGMPNMSYFFELAEIGRRELVKRGEKTAILFTDLSGMKLFNDKYGFQEGDNLLRQLAKVLVGHFGNECCSRFGQDHFSVCTSVNGLEEKLGQIIKEASELNEGKTLPLRIGVYIDETGEEEIARACDKAIYACDGLKGSYGSSYHYYNEKMLSEAVNRRYVVENLDKALEQKWIKVFYQPIVRAANGCVCNEEALSRWMDPEKGMLSPAEYIPAIEDAGLIYKLDLFVVEQIMQKLKEQSEAGFHTVPVSVNISRSDFDSCDMVEEIRRRVDESGVGRDMLSIEITESVIGRDFEFMKEQVERFRALGFQVWMDDFGSGYLSLDVLQSIRFDLIKLDMRFMQKFDKNDDSRVILTELIKMAIGLRIETVCEGVETAEQVEFLREIGCTKLQGFYYTKPIPQEEIYERYRKGIQISFEDPEQSDYYAAIGRINLYDAAFIAEEEQESFGKYFNTIPMAIIETDADSFTLIRCNSTYNTFLIRNFGTAVIGVPLEYKFVENMEGYGFLKALRNCGLMGGRMMIDEEVANGAVAHAFIKRIAVNSVTNTSAVAVAVLSVRDTSDEKEVTFAHIAKALSSDYFNLFYVNLKTEQFSEFTSDADIGVIAVERHGDNFFEASRRDARRLLYEPDREDFIRAFTKENVVRALDCDGAFNVISGFLTTATPST